MSKTVAPEIFIADWLGAPHTYNGRSKRGIDCYGLVWQWYHDVLGIKLPDWSCADLSRKWVSRFMAGQLEQNIEWIGDPRNHCLVVFGKDRPHHIGLVWRHYIFHVPEGGFVSLQHRNQIADIYAGQTLRFGVPHDAQGKI